MPMTGTAGRARLWCVAALVAAAPVVAAPAADLSGYAGRYRQVLAEVAAGDQQAAVERLVALELEALGGSPAPRQIEGFWRLKLSVVGELLEQAQPDVLVPVILLHHDAYLAHRGERRWQLANHSRTMAVELVEFYLQKAPPGGDGRLVASRILTSFAGYLQEGWSMGLASGLFRRALELDPANQAAIFGMAAGYEKLGRYRDALEFLERAVAVSPGNTHVRLRLALCAGRLGETERARREMERLIADEPPAWVLALAYQELAGIAIAAGDPMAALALVSAGLERLPGEPHLAVQRALLLDRTRQRRAASELVERMKMPEADARESARYRYTRWPVELLTEVRRELAGDLAARRGQLTAGLASAGDEVAGG